MGKSTISMAIFNSFLLVYQRVTMGFAGGFSTHLQIEWLMNTPGSESADFAGSATNHHRFPADLSLHFMGIPLW